MSVNSEEMLKKTKKNMETLKELTNEQLIMLTLAEIIMCIEDMPIGQRVPLHATLRERSGVKF